MKILYIQASWVPPSLNPQLDRFFLLSPHLEGDILHPVWFDQSSSVEAEFGPDTFPVYSRGSFRYHWFLSFKYPGWQRRLATQWFYLSKGLELHRRNPYDCIIVYSHMMPALVAVLLKLLTGAKLIVEIATSPEHSYLYEHPTPTLGNRLMRLFSNFCIHASGLFCDRFHLLYASQLQYFPRLAKVPFSVFHEFVTTSSIGRARDDERCQELLFVGTPWFLKGVDLLIQAFRKIAPDFPQVTLTLQGHQLDHPQVKDMVAGCSQIQIIKAEPNPATVARISRALCLILPSRCEGMGRVLLEAMAAGVPVIGSDAGGIPHYIQRGQNGLVFASQQVDELSGCLREILSDNRLRQRLGDNGYRIAHTQYTEQVYVQQFTQMVSATLHPVEQPR